MPTRKKYKKWLVTGGAGFIGSAMIRDLLLDPSLHILNIDALTYAGNLSSLPSSSEHPHYTFLKADVADVDHMKRVFLEFQPDCVIHFAAESHVDRSIDGPADFLKTNIWGTFSLLEAARGYLKVHPEKKDSFRFHHISTDEVFGALPREGKFSEKTAYDPRSPYSASKAGSDHLIRAWYHTYEIPITISNCSNNYGPFHFPEKLIPLAILSALHDQPINVYGDGKNVRDWLYVDDHIRAIHLVLARGKAGDTYVVGGYGEKTNIEVVQLICALLDKKFHRTAQTSFSNQIAFVSDRPGHDYRYAIDPHKIQTDLGWRPQKTFDQGISDTIDWYVNNPWWWEPIWSQKHPGKRLGIV